jgi:hypothetical protein
MQPPHADYGAVFALFIGWAGTPRVSITLLRSGTYMPRMAFVGVSGKGWRKECNASRRGEGLAGSWAVLCVRALVEHPAGYHPLLTQKKTPAGDGCCLQVLPDPGHPGRLEVAGPPSHGLHVRLPTHRRPCFHDPRLACDRLGRAAPWPGGMCTRWTTNKVSWRHRTSTPL